MVQSDRASHSARHSASVLMLLPSNGAFGWPEIGTPYTADSPRTSTHGTKGGGGGGGDGGGAGEDLSSRTANPTASVRGCPGG
jgi:hypothetical protein